MRSEVSSGAVDPPADWDSGLEPYRGWRGLVAGDYDRAVLRVAIATQSGRRQLLFASVELLPTEIPNPPEAFEKDHFKGVQLSVCRVIVPLEVPSRRWLELGWRSLRVAQPQ